MADNYLEKQAEKYEANKNAHRQGHKNRSRTENPISPRLRVMVTGGASGIGKAIVETFCAARHQVAFCDTNKEAGMATAEATGARYFEVDVRNTEAIENMMDELFIQWKDIDVLVNNVGISTFSPLTETTVEQFDNVLSVNLRPVFITSRKLALHRKAQTRPPHTGRIINICSTRYLMSEPGSEGYAASKGGIWSLTHALALSMAPYRITVNSISPGWIQNTHYEELRPEDHLQHPSQRVGKSEDIARMCLFLSHEANDFINGENITIDGGMTKKMIYIEDEP